MEFIYENVLKYEYDNKEILVIIDKFGKLWFRAKEIALAMDYEKTKEAIRENTHLDERRSIEKIKLDYRPPGIANSTVFLTESGFYRFIIRSRKSKSDNFIDWIVYDVLPSIREKGSYVVHSKLKHKLNNLKKMLDERSEELKEYKKRVEVLEYNQKDHKYDKGGIIYILKPPHTDKFTINTLKVGITNLADKCFLNYNTGHADKPKILYFEKVKNPKLIEICVKYSLNMFRYSGKKEFFDCDLDVIIKVIKKCIKFANSATCKDCKSKLSRNSKYENKDDEDDDKIIDEIINKVFDNGIEPDCKECEANIDKILNKIQTKFEIDPYQEDYYIVGILYENE